MCGWIFKVLVSVWSEGPSFSAVTGESLAYVLHGELEPTGGGCVMELLGFPTMRKPTLSPGNSPLWEDSHRGALVQVRGCWEAGLYKVPWGPRIQTPALPREPWGLAGGELWRRKAQM